MSDDNSGGEIGLLMIGIGACIATIINAIISAIGKLSIALFVFPFDWS